MLFLGSCLALLRQLVPELGRTRKTRSEGVLKNRTKLNEYPWESNNELIFLHQDLCNLRMYYSSLLFLLT